MQTSHDKFQNIPSNFQTLRIRISKLNKSKLSKSTSTTQAMESKNQHISLQSRWTNIHPFATHQARQNLNIQMTFIPGTESVNRTNSNRNKHFTQKARNLEPAHLTVPLLRGVPKLNQQNLTMNCFATVQTIRTLFIHSLPPLSHIANVWRKCPAPYPSVAVIVVIIISPPYATAKKSHTLQTVHTRSSSALLDDGRNMSTRRRFELPYPEWL